MEKLARIYINEMVARHGVPVFIISERDSRLMAQFWQTLQKALRRRLDMSTTYHPQINGQSERTIQTLEDMLRKYVIDFGGNWNTHIPLVEFSHNNSYHISIKCALFEALKGSRQQETIDNRCKPLEFSIGDEVLLKLSPWKGIVRYGIKGKLASRSDGIYVEALNSLGSARTTSSTSTHTYSRMLHF
ncbi:putative reverse transcriptase domain-containing protein [Tanacetum coccineum]